MSSETFTSPAASANLKALEAGLPVTVSSHSLPWPVAPGWLKDYLMTQVNPDLSTIPLAAYCFMTGWMCVVLAHVLSFFIAIADSVTATQSISPPYSFGADSKLATRYR